MKKLKLCNNQNRTSLCVFLICSWLCLLCCSCARQREQPKEDGFTSDFEVKNCWKEKTVITKEDYNTAAKLVCRFVLQTCPEQICETETYYLSQPYPFLNLDERKYDVFLFNGERCIGILTLSENNGKYEGSFTGPLDEKDISELSEWLLGEKAFVLLTDGMRLWFVSEKESFPWNLKELEGPTISWKEEYAPFVQVLKLTEIHFFD